MRMMCFGARILVVAAGAAAAGCGQKGPLVLPPPAPAPQSRPAERPEGPPADAAAARRAGSAGESRLPDVPATSEPR
jgi:predicted small lipoprotein YifL